MLDAHGSSEVLHTPSEFKSLLGEILDCPATLSKTPLQLGHHHVTLNRSMRHNCRMV